MSFRDATQRDKLLVFRWRVEAEKAAWWEGKPVSFAAHDDWYTRRLVDPLVQLLIWEEAGRPVGMVRIDSNGELSFYAPSDWVAVRMLQAAQPYAAEYGGRLKATLDAEDPRAGLLEDAGFKPYPAVFLAYR